MSEVQVRPARPADSALIHRFVLQLAAYEKLLHAVEADAADIARLLFGPQPHAACEIAEIDGQPVGFSLWFYTVSTFAGRAGLYLEDLYVIPEGRGRGAGRALLCALARRCVAEDLGLMEWSVLNWNAPAIAFYDRVGAESLGDWTVRRLSGDALRALARA